MNDISISTTHRQNNLLKDVWIYVYQVLMLLLVTVKVSESLWNTAWTRSFRRWYFCVEFLYKCFWSDVRCCCFWTETCSQYNLCLFFDLLLLLSLYYYYYYFYLFIYLFIYLFYF